MDVRVILSWVVILDAGEVSAMELVAGGTMKVAVVGSMVLELEDELIVVLISVVDFSDESVL